MKLTISERLEKRAEEIIIRLFPPMTTDNPTMKIKRDEINIYGTIADGSNVTCIIKIYDLQVL